MFTTYAQKQAPAQKKDAPSASSVLDLSSQSESLQRKAVLANGAAQREEALRPNNTGMPDNLKAGIENLSGFSMDDVRVHYNSSKPATVQALAYTQGTDIHVAPGQEKHLPHEAWHVAQQMAGRVSPTININGMPVNDNAALEHEADVMGEKAVQCKNGASSELKQVHDSNISVQRYVKEGDYILSKKQGNDRKIAVKENEASTIYIKEGNEIPGDLQKLGLVVVGTKTIKVNGNDEEYQIVQQGMIKRIKEQEDGLRMVFDQDELNKDDQKGTKSLLNNQLKFIRDLIKKCKYENFIGNKKNEVKKKLKKMIDKMKNSVPLKCLGLDIINAAFVMYYLVCKENFNESDGLVLEVIKDDLTLRLSQVENEMNSAGFKPLVRTECSGSAIDRTMLMKGYPLKTDYARCVSADKRYVVANFNRTDFADLPWLYHVGSSINQDLTDDSLFVEDAVGKSSDACERANAHWFAHIYGVKEPASSGGALVGEMKVFPYPVGDCFLMNNRFNSVLEGDKPRSIKDKIRNFWQVSYDKIIDIDQNKRIDLNLHLRVYLNDDCKFIGLFDRCCMMMVEGEGVEKISEKESNKIFNEYHNYLVGVMDFMVQTANSAIDGWFVGKYAELGLTDVEGKNMREYIFGRHFGYGDTSDASLLSIYKANQPSQN